MVTKGMFWKRFYFVVVLLSCNCFLVCSNKVCEGVKNFFGCGQQETDSNVISVEEDTNLNNNINNNNNKLKNENLGEEEENSDENNEHDDIIAGCKFYNSKHNKDVIDLSRCKISKKKITSYLKCVFLSSTPCLGKTSIIRYLSDKNFVEEYTATIGLDVFFKTYEEESGKVNIRMQMWDCLSGKKYINPIGGLMRNALAVVFVYDVTSKVSFDNLQNYITDVKEQASEECLFFLLGNKLDLASEEQRQVTTEEAKKFAADNGLIFLGECSAKTNTYMPVQELYYKKENLQDGKCTEGLDGMLKDIIYDIVSIKNDNQNKME